MPEVERNDFVADRTNRKDSHVNVTALFQDLHDRLVLAHDRCRLRTLKDDGKGQVTRLRGEGLAKRAHHLEVVRRTRREGRPALELDNAHALTRRTSQVRGDRTHRAAPGDTHAHAVVDQLAHQVGTDATNLINGLVLRHGVPVRDAHA